jgi:hypothetical protein
VFAGEVEVALQITRVVALGGGCGGSSVVSSGVKVGSAS